MHVLAPIDGSECSYRALSFATEFVTRYEASLDVVHISTQEGPKTEKILRRAEEVLEENDVPANAEIVTNLESADPRYGNRKGKDILRLVEKNGYDHVIMGHHGAGAVGRLVLGTAAGTVMQAAEVPTTIIP